MKNLFRFPLVILIICLAAILKAQDGQTVYRTFCIGCHGFNLEGGTAATLIKEDWMYGKTRDHMIRNIQFGIPGTEMVAWGELLGEERVRAVVDFIIKAQKNPPQTERKFPKKLRISGYKLKVKVLAEGEIRTPWGIEFVDDNRALVTEMPGGLRWLVNGKLDPEPISGIPQPHIYRRGDNGMMDVALDPDYRNNGWIYLAFSQTDGAVGDGQSPAMTKIVRGKIRDHQWTQEETVFSVPEAIRVSRGTRWGGRMLFDQEGYLFFSVGDLGVEDDCQDLSRPNGKIFRVYPDGSIPEDNPFVEVDSALPAIYAFGSRNAQGFSIHPETGDIWFAEHGPMGGDELNILKKGANYGWPVITYGKHYDGKIVSPLTVKEGMQQPVTFWTPSIAVCPVEFCSSPLFPAWKNSLIVGALGFEELRKLKIEGEEVVEQEILMKNHGRVRDVKFGKDGALYVLMNSPDAVLRITPKK